MKLPWTKVALIISQMSAIFGFCQYDIQVLQNDVLINSVFLYDGVITAFQYQNGRVFDILQFMYSGWITSHFLHICDAIKHLAESLFEDVNRLWVLPDLVEVSRKWSFIKCFLDQRVASWSFHVLFELLAKAHVVKSEAAGVDVFNYALQIQAWLREDGGLDATVVEIRQDVGDDVSSEAWTNEEDLAARVLIYDVSDCFPKTLEFGRRKWNPIASAMRHASVIDQGPVKIASIFSFRNQCVMVVVPHIWRESWYNYQQWQFSIGIYIMIYGYLAPIFHYENLPFESFAVWVVKDPVEIRPDARQPRWPMPIQQSKFWFENKLIELRLRLFDTIDHVLVAIYFQRVRNTIGYRKSKWKR